MSGKKSSRGAVSKISSTSMAATQNARKSSILKSSFAPSRLQLSLFASVIQGFDSQHLRIHDTNTGRIRCEHATGPTSKVTSLDWGFYGRKYRDQCQENLKRKRKRGADVASDARTAESAVLAFGTSQSEICMFSLSEGKVVKKLSGSHERGIVDFKFNPADYLAGWSIGGEGNLIQWDLSTNQAIRSIILPDPGITILAIPPTSSPVQQISAHLLCASATPYSITLTSSSDQQIETFNSFRTPIHSLISSDLAAPESDWKFLAADNDRYVNVFDAKKNQLIRSLVIGSGVQDLSISSTKTGKNHSSPQLLAVTTQNGSVELFENPFMPPQQSDVNGSVKSKRKNFTLKAQVSVRLIKPDANGTPISIFHASIQDSDIILASADGGLDVSFEKLKWQDEITGELLFDGVKEVVRSKNVSTLNSATMNGVKDVRNTHVDESKTVVVDAAAQNDSQVAAIEISSEAQESQSSEDSESEDESDEGADASDDKAQDSEMESDAEMADAELQKSGRNSPDVDPEAEAVQEPSFGELLAAKNPETISIAKALAPAESSALVVADSDKTLAAPSGISMSTVLSQSLRTNDQNLLESCFHSTDLSTIRLTIQRLDSSLAGILLQKLAERLSSRPGRYGHLLVWVQWTCVAHGGAIAGHPDVTEKVKTLYKVLSQRSRSLDNLLLLKGKLDMLDAQLSLRKQLRAERGAVRGAADEDDVIYIEGQDEESSSDEDEVSGSKPTSAKARAPKKSLQDLVPAEEEEDDDDEIPLTNGILHSDAEEESDADGSESEDDDDALVLHEADESADGEDGDDDDSHPSDRQSDSEDDDEAADSDEDPGSEMDDFINDGSISELDESASEVSIAAADDDDTPQKPPSKKPKRS